MQTTSRPTRLQLRALAMKDEGMTRAQVAAALNVSPGAAKKLWTRGRKAKIEQAQADRLLAAAGGKRTVIRPFSLLPSDCV